MNFSEVSPPPRRVLLVSLVCVWPTLIRRVACFHADFANGEGGAGGPHSLSHFAPLGFLASLGTALVRPMPYLESGNRPPSLPPSLLPYSLLTPFFSLRLLSGSLRKTERQ